MDWPPGAHASTFGGNPVCCAAALANLEVIIEDRLAEQANLKGLFFKQELSGIQQIKEIRQIGLMLGIELDSTSTIEKLIQNFIKHGLITDRFLFLPNAFRIAPPSEAQW